MKKVKWNGEELSVQFGSYASGHTLIQLFDAEGMPYARATVNIPTEELGEKEVFIKNYSENEGVLSALIEAGIVEDTGRRVTTGYVQVPVCKILVPVWEMA